MRPQRELVALASSQARLSEAREELTRADAKISTILAAEGIVAGVVLAAMIDGDWSPQTLPACAPTLWWTGAVLWLASLGTFGYGIYPRTKRKGPSISGISAYYADTQNADDASHGAKAERALERRRVEDQVTQMNWIVRRKYAAIQWGLWLVAGGSVLLIASSIWDFLV